MTILPLRRDGDVRPKRRNKGLILVNDLVRRAGNPGPDFYAASAISGDGKWVFAIGNPGHSEHDTNSVVFRLP